MFDTHKLNENGFKEVQEFKTLMALAANQALSLLPDSREKSLFVTKLEEAMFFGTKALAAKTTNHTEITTY